MKSFKQFLTEAKIDTSNRDDKIMSYLEKKYNIKNKNNIRVYFEGSPNDIGIELFTFERFKLSDYNDMVEFNKNINKFIANENINKIKKFTGKSVKLNFNVDEAKTVVIDNNYTDKIIKDSGGDKKFDDKYGENSSYIFSHIFNLGNTKVADIVKKGSYNVVFPKGSINVPVDKLYWFDIDSPSFAFNLKDNYNLVKNSGAATEFSPIKIESFVNDVSKIVGVLNNIAALFEGNSISNKELSNLSIDLTKQAIKFRKNLKILIKSRIDELKNSYDSSNEKSVIESYISNLKDLLNIL